MTFEDAKKLPDHDGQRPFPKMAKVKMIDKLFGDYWWIWVADKNGMLNIDISEHECRG